MSEEAVVQNHEAEPVDYVAQYGQDVVDQAKMLGWKDPQDWEGEKPAGFIGDPQRWVERAFNNPAVQALKGQMERIEGAMAAQVARQRQDYETQIKALSAQKEEAMKSGDSDTYVELDQKQRVLEQAMPKDDAPQEGGLPVADKAIMDRWAAERPWIKDPVKNAASAALWNQARAQGMTDVQAILASVDRGMKEQFADLQDPKPILSKVGGGHTTAATPSAFAKLPPDAKAAFEKFFKQGAYGEMDIKDAQAQYAEDYQ